MTRPVEVERCHHEHTTSFTGARLGRPAVPFAKWERCIAEPPSHVRTIDVRHVQTTVYPSGAWVRVVAFVPPKAAEQWSAA